MVYIWFNDDDDIHRLSEMDIELMKRLGMRVNIIPVIAKADSLRPAEMKEFKKRIMEDIVYHQIPVFAFPFDPSADDEETIAENRELRVREIMLIVMGGLTLTREWCHFPLSGLKINYTLFKGEKCVVVRIHGVFVRRTIQSTVILLDYVMCYSSRTPVIIFFIFAGFTFVCVARTYKIWKILHMTFYMNNIVHKN